MSDVRVARRLSVTGVVQGVGFRPFAFGLAVRLGLSGWVLNHSGGVDIQIEGEAATLHAFEHALVAEAPPLARIEGVSAADVAPEGLATFEIRHSQVTLGQHQLIAPDVATCDDCLCELLDPADRRHRYPFINCTNCGPRFTIIAELPYDRPNTTMSAFPLCGDCQSEYDDPLDRRFHAQPNACPVCGPHLWLVDGQGAPLVASEEQADDEAVLREVQRLLLGGAIVAIKGLGGFHLACDATNASAVATLRARKRRPHKPLAVMVSTLDDARDLAAVDAAAGEALASVQRPIVLLDQRPDTLLADGVAPHSAIVGLLLPATPLHHLIVRDAGRPLVMTSGNLSEEPIAKDNDEALARLGGLADAILLHNRGIHSRYDDSVVQSLGITGFPTQLVRRARSYAPFPVRLPFSAPPLLAVGPLLKNTFCLTRDRHAFVSQHIGDLEDLDALSHYRETLALYERLFRLSPERVVCDLHPDYLSTRLAREYARERGLPAPLAVQHHRAHVAAVMADNGWPLAGGPVVGVAMDGTGLGEDGAIWGGEWFVGDYAHLERRAHLQYLPLPGGDTATRQPWRIAAAYALALLGEGELLAGLADDAELALLRAQLAAGVNVPRTSSMGRLFDAVSALLGVTRQISYEAQAAIELEQVAANPKSDVASYPWSTHEAQGVETVELAPLWDTLAAQVQQGAPAPLASLRFHRTVANIIAQVSLGLARRYGASTVALSGGVFQNRLLLRLAVPLLQQGGVRVLLHRETPCNDGGVSLGQAALASALLQKEG
jgi:hydrogenase maturation protein HypF